MNAQNPAPSTSSGDHKILNRRYELKEREGVGGMAHVYRAEDIALRRVVAIKVLREDLAEEQDLVKQFLREARAVAHLSHPNVVAVHDVGSDRHRHYMVLEHVAGEDFKSHIRLDAPFSIEHTLDYAIQICAGVGHAHRHGLVHCDIKPQNILVTPDGKVKVADFGISRLLSATQPIETSATLFGTPHYFSPEQAQGSPATPASDVYSIGVLLFEMLTGRLPFDAPDAHVLGHMHVHADAPDIRGQNPAIPDTVAEIIAKVLAKEPSARYRTAEHLGHVLITFRDQGAQATRPFLALNSDELDAHIIATGATRAADAGGAAEVDWVTYLLGASAALLVLGLLALWTRVFWRLAPFLLSAN
ncbi:MAG: protein kinase [Anaerolineales bacterium]|nr:protein kinase [Anaerolineales bacterium]HJO34460.1 protein kinase [Anaerolineales bacterium]